MNKLQILLFTGILLGACQTPAVFEQYDHIKNEEWCRGHVVELNASIPDSGRYMVEILLRHTTDYEMANLWCFVSTRSKATQEIKDTLNIKIAESDGLWLGEGRSIKSLAQPLRHNLVTLPQGSVTFRIEQGMRQDCMKGIKDIGIRIEKVK